MLKTNNLYIISPGMCGCVEFQIKSISQYPLASKKEIRSAMECNLCLESICGNMPIGQNTEITGILLLFLLSNAYFRSLIFPNG